MALPPYINLCSGCPDTLKCSEDKYCGPNLPGTGILTNDSIIVALQKIDQAIFSITGVNLATTTTTTAAPTTSTTTTLGDIE